MLSTLDPPQVNFLVLTRKMRVEWLFNTALDDGVEIHTNELLYEEESAVIQEKQNRTL